MRELIEGELREREMKAYKVIKKYCPKQNNNKLLCKFECRRLPEPTGGSPVVVHLINIPLQSFSSPMRVLEDVPLQNCVFTLMLSGALRSRLKLKVR